MSNHLTDARNALHDAIDAWPALADKFAKTWRLNAPAKLAALTPAANQLPCLVIMPAKVKPEWDTTAMQEWPYVVAVTIFTEINADESEELAVSVIDAAYQSHPEDNPVPYVARATAGDPLWAYIEWEKVQVGTGAGIDALQATVYIALRVNHDPLGRG